MEKVGELEDCLVILEKLGSVIGIITIQRALREHRHQVRIDKVLHHRDIQRNYLEVTYVHGYHKITVMVINSLMGVVKPI